MQSVVQEATTNGSIKKISVYAIADFVWNLPIDGAGPDLWKK